MARSKVKSRSHHDVALLQHPTNVSTKYQLLHLTVAEIWPGQDFKGKSHYSKTKVKASKVTPWRGTTTAQPVKFVTPVKFDTAFYNNIKEFLLSSYGICVYLAVERSYSIYLNVNIVCS